MFFPEKNTLNNSVEHWNKALEKLVLSPEEKRLIILLYSDGIEGDDQFRLSSLIQFFEQCQAMNIDPKKLQEKLMELLSPGEVQRLLKLVPKGVRLELHASLQSNGINPQASSFYAQLLDRLPMIGLNPETESLEDVPNENIQNVFGELLTAGLPTFDDTVQGVVVAERWQGYSADLRLKLEDGAHIDYDTTATFKFILLSVDQDETQRRPRELYPLKRVQVWHTALQCWLPGKITDRPKSGYIQVRFDDAVQVPHVLGGNQKMDSLQVWVGESQLMGGENLDTFGLPQLGKSSFEQSPALFEHLDLTDEKTELPYSQVPEEFRPGHLILFPNQTIGEVTFASAQGTAAVKGSDRHGQASLDQNSINWIELEDEKMPEVLQEVKESTQSTSWKLRVVKVPLSALESTQDEMPSLESRTLRVRGVFTSNSDITPRVILETLPVTLGKNANFLPQLFYSFSLTEFNQLLNDQTITMADQLPAESITQYFPDQEENIWKYLDEYGGLVATVQLKDGNFCKESYVMLHSLPFGIWMTFNDRKPRLITLNQVESFTPISSLD